jgi:hypothetical protein
MSEFSKRMSNLNMQTATPRSTSVCSESGAKKSFKINPVAFKYKMVSFALIEKDDCVMAEFNTGSYPIQYQYTPCSQKGGHVCFVKVEFSASDRSTYKEAGLQNLTFNCGSYQPWTVTVNETTEYILFELQSGPYPMSLDMSNKLITTSQSPCIASKDNVLTIRMLQAECC